MAEKAVKEMNGSKLFGARRIYVEWARSNETIVLYTRNMLHNELMHQQGHHAEHHVQDTAPDADVGTLC